MFAPAFTMLGPAVALIAPSLDTADAIRAASKDVGKLLELARSWSAARDDQGACAAWSRVLERDAENEEAHKGLRHHAYADRWFADGEGTGKSVEALQKALIAGERELPKFARP